MKTPRLGRVFVLMSCTSLIELLLPRSNAQVALGPPIEISLPNPLAGCNDAFNTSRTWTDQDAAEPLIAVNPVNPKNIVAA